jgi:hypothetical protein
MSHILPLCCAFELKKAESQTSLVVFLLRGLSHIFSPHYIKREKERDTACATDGSSLCIFKLFIKKSTIEVYDTAFFKLRNTTKGPNMGHASTLC